MFVHCRRKKRSCTVLLALAICLAVSVYFTSEGSGVGTSTALGHRRPNQFKYLINPRDTCSDRSDVYLLVVVYSSPANFVRRNVIRKTWNQRRLFNLAKVSVLFFVGATDQPSTQAALNKEYFVYNDIVQQDYVDSYYNLSLKASSWLQWVTEYCHEPNFILKTDDDVLVDIFKLVDLLRFMTKIYHNTNIDIHNLIIGSKWSNSPVHRDEKSKFVVSIEEYDKPTYPDFCSGTGYVMSRKLLPMLLEAARSVSVFKFEDVWVTGFLRVQIGANIYDIGNRYDLEIKKNEDMDNCNYIFRLFESYNKKWTTTWNIILGDNVINV